jgi:hypothetical protein
MSTSAVNSASLNQQLNQYFQTRGSDARQLGQALSSGDLAAAKTAYNNIVALGKNGPFASGNPFRLTSREQDFTAVGKALQSGDLAGAQQAFDALKSTFGNGKNLTPNPGTHPTPASGAEIVLNLSNNNGGSASPEQVTINIANAANGGEQVSLSVGEQGSNPQQITFNLNPTSNEQVIVNLPGAGASTNGSSGSPTTGSGSPASGGISVSA